MGKERGKFPSREKKGGKPHLGQKIGKEKGKVPFGGKIKGENPI